MRWVAFSFGLLGAFLLGMAGMFALNPQDKLAGSAAMKAGIAGTYALLGLLFGVFAVGLGLLKRWARNLAIQLLWPWLACGLLAAPALPFLLPSFFSATFAANGLSAQVLEITVWVMTALDILMGVAWPALMLLALNGEREKAACLAAQPEPDWTEGCPPRAFSLSLAFGLYAVSCFPGMMMANFYVPLFGSAIYGLQGAFALIGLAILAGRACYGAYRQEGWVWWLGIAGTPLWSISYQLTLGQLGWAGIMRVMHPEMDEALVTKSAEMMQNFPALTAALALNGLLLFYFWYVRRDFIGETKPG